VTAMIFVRTWAEVIALGLGFLSALAGFGLAFRALNCVVSECARIGRFWWADARYCRKHHPLIPSKGRIYAPGDADRTGR